MAPRAVSNPLALAVLATLCERPMHPYEMATTMRTRQYDTAVKLNYGSLYSVVDSLQRHGHIDVAGVERSGRRPERTIYAITATGRDELSQWLRSMLSTPVREYPSFPAALAFMVALAPTDARDRLAARAEHLDGEIARTREMIENAARGNDQHPAVERVFLLEDEYQLTMRQAELDWVRALIEEIDSGSLPGLATWADQHVHNGRPATEDAAAR